MLKQSKWNDRHRHKDAGLKTMYRQANRRSRYDARTLARVETRESIVDLALDRVIVALCREAGVA